MAGRRRSNPLKTGSPPRRQAKATRTRASVTERMKTARNPADRLWIAASYVQTAYVTANRHGHAKPRDLTDMTKTLLARGDALLAQDPHRRRGRTKQRGARALANGRVRAHDRQPHRQLADAANYVRAAWQQARLQGWPDQSLRNETAELLKLGNQLTSRYRRKSA